MDDYIRLVKELEERSTWRTNTSWVAVLMVEAAQMIRKQGDELKSLKANTYVRCPRCHQMVTRILESGQCGFCELMS
jgi:hypothetical protein